MDNHWKDIWNSKKDNFDLIDASNPEQIFLELKRIDGFDVVGDGLSYDALKAQYEETKKALCLGAGDSVFEVGCGSGANLYLFRQDGIRIGGLDYSKTLIQIMKKAFKDENLEECICDEADKLPVGIKYDAVFSNSVFSYFPDYDYACRVLKKMTEKARSCIGLLDIHDMKKKEAFCEYRKETIPNYEEKYKGLPKLFYEKEFFSDYAMAHNMRVEFFESRMEGYWNNEFVFHCFLYKQIS